MTDREVMQQALDALSWIANVNAMDYEYQRKAREPIEALRQALAQPEQEELIQFKDGKWSYVRKPWVGLTDDEKESVYKHADAENHQLSKVVSAVEWLLKNKNTT